ncbi:sensor domain-containing diguanylate cyclase [Paenibacillus dakarensis]|uniref:sensor domain-containing diguanylate cyclase n=1 Tax=Paenibacillus dakarensis TaxID=1527293 RepID=UPI0006D57B67|nr:sensor domain-containing diguanylate cyclase [Paenibacillus dakarensis]
MSGEQQNVFGSSPSSSALLAGSEQISGTDSFTWHESMDITPMDFPYLQQLLTESYDEWKKDSSGLPMVSESDWCIMGPEGEWITGNPKLYDYFSTGEDIILKRALVNKATAAGPGEDRHGAAIICASPVFSRFHHDLFAVLISVSRSGADTHQIEFMTESAAIILKTCFYRRFEYIFIKDMAQIQRKAEHEANRRSNLFQYVKRMHTKIDVDGVLTEVLESVLGLYPYVDVRLFMSQDHHSSHPLVCPLLLHHWQEEVYMRTFMEGVLTVSEHLEGPDLMVEIGVPMGGKQGVYGVLYLRIKHELMAEMDLELLGMMADAAGTAFENAKLYEQSNLMIHELRVINELTQQLNKSLQLSEIYQFANDELLKILAAEYCCIMCYSEALGGLEVVSCNVPELAKEVFEKNYGLAGHIYHSKQPMFLADYTVERPAESKLMDSTGSNSMIGTPLTVNGEIRGVILLTHRRRHYFSYDNYRLLQALTSHIGLAVGNAFLHAEVRWMANRDMLTELYARHYLDEVIHDCQNRDFCGSLIVVDIDQFKQVNDTFGHQRGDKILKQVSSIVKTSIRQSDIAARWGGEELAVYLPGLGIEQAVQVAERIRLRVADETDPRVTVSCGISEWNWEHDRISVESLFYRADMALYDAKHSGRNRIVVEKREASE